MPLFTGFKVFGGRVGCQGFFSRERAVFRRRYGRETNTFTDDANGRKKRFSGTCKKGWTEEGKAAMIAGGRG